MFNLFKRGLNSKKALNLGVERERNYRYIYAAGGNLDASGNIVLHCKDLIFKIPANSKKALLIKVKAEYGYNPIKDYLIFDNNDLKGVKNIIAVI